jgi:hypothetical protein
MNWYLLRNGQQYGPYDPQAMQAMALEGRLAPQDTIWHEGLPGWIQASQAGFRWPSTPLAAPLGTPVAKPPRKKRRFGCLGCLGAALLVPVLLIGAFLLWMGLKDSGNMSLGSAVKVASETIPPEGGTISLGSSNLTGMTIEVVGGSYATPTPFTVQTTEIKDHKLGPLFHPATPLITIDNGHAFAEHPMTVKIPVEIGDDEFALGFYYNRKSGKLEGIPLVTEDAGSITLMTRHFSDLVISKAKKEDIIKELPADSGFRPGVDDWQFVNNGSWLERAGHCAGQSMSAMWYYVEKKKGANERGLYGRFDNNDYGTGTIDLDQDDSWGYRFASVVQRELDWNNLMRWIMLKFKGFDTRLTWLAFAYSIQVTGEPQYIGIRGQLTGNDGVAQDVGHAMVVYKADAKGLYVADPNYPGQEGRQITYAQAGLEPYESGLNREEIKQGKSIRFPVLLYIGKTSMADWGKIGARYAQVLDGTIGNDTFPKWEIKYLIKEGEDMKWIEVPKVLETDEPTTMKPGPAYKGFLRFSVRFPYSDFQAYRVDIYKDTSIVATEAFDAQGRVYHNLELEKGVNNLGFYYYKLDGSTKHYIDFRRVKIIYGEDDLTGTWNGQMVARPTAALRSYLEDGIVFVLKKFLPERSEADLRSAAAASIEEHVAELPFTLTLTRRGNDKKTYDFVMEHLGEDGRPWRTEGQADYETGTLTFRAKAADGSVADYQGSLSGKGALNGSLKVNAWGLVSDAVTGEWKATKQP